MPATLSENLFVALQHILPKTLLTELAGRVANSRSDAVKRLLIPRFVAKYGVNMAEAAEPDPLAYDSFNDFFTRALKPGARPIADADVVCPVDGAVSQMGRIEADQIFQAKGHHYSTRALLGGDAALAAQFQDGEFATIYLSPKDYHRIHMPVTGRLTRMVYVPGALYSVNPATARGVPGLFARNERVVCVFDTDHGPFALVLVGATIVGSMATAWHGVVNPPRRADVTTWNYENDSKLSNAVWAKSDEMGRFLLGSTVVLLWPKGTVRFNPGWVPERVTRMGEAMGQWV